MMQIICTPRERDYLIHSLEDTCPFENLICPTVLKTFNVKTDRVRISCEQCIKENIDWTLVDENGEIID